MDAEENLTALKKAYADVILNASKEAAMKVMASAGKEVRHQHELKETNEEALRLLLRLKQMMDSKISESEAVSLSQLKKIEELEAQLHEAEDIVRDLREELRVAKTELERVKSDNFQPSNEPDNYCPREALLNNIMCSYQSNTSFPPNLQNESAVASDVAIPFLSRRNESFNCCNKLVCMCSSCNGNRDLPSIISRRKEHGLHRNECTQGIRACERNLMDRELCLPGKTDEVKNTRNDREVEEVEEACKSPASGDTSLSELKKKLLTGANNGSFVPYIRRRKRAPRLSTYKPELQSQPGFAVSTEKETNLVEIGGAKNAMQKGGGLIENKVPVRGKNGFAESMSPDCKMEPEQVDVPLNNLEASSSNTTIGISSQPVGKRVIKYTYERKRKRSALSVSDVKGSLGKKEKLGDKPNGDQKLELPKSSLLVESVKSQ